MSRTRYNTSHEAEEAFYRAFEQANFDLMASVWRDADHIECIHPLSDRLSGTKAVHESWRSMFQQPPGIAIKIGAQRHNIGTTLAVHSVDEHITLIEGDRMTQSVIHTTNVYQYVDSSWQMILHHASPSRQPQKIQNISSEAIH
ncbi:MAG: nuclear transport factor 2 family protein [Gammaproteobacteria bacterium]|nr:nuclear transport factor 2 family protein [Gammaproteobacteria bacterium]